MTSKIIIGSIICNRAWVLLDYLEALKNISYPNKEYLFLENDSTDSTFDILNLYKLDAVSRVIHITTNSVNWKRGDYNANNFQHLATIRNIFLELFLETGADYLLSVDSDVIVPPDILGKLLDIVAKHSSEKIIVGAAICNIPDGQLNGHIPGNFMTLESDGKIRHPQNYPPFGIMEVDVIGACYLIPRQAILDDVKYGPHLQGEDLYFCQLAKQKGYKLIIDFDIRPEHRMVEPVKSVKSVNSSKRVTEV